MIEKNEEKQKRKIRNTWLPYYTRVVKKKKGYTRKRKHKNAEQYSAT